RPVKQAPPGARSARPQQWLFPRNADHIPTKERRIMYQHWLTYLGCAPTSRGHEDMSLISVRKRRSQRKQGFRPSLEVLETRTLLSAGSIDATFGSGGKVVTDMGANSEAIAVTVQPKDDKIVVAGYTAAGGGNFALARYNPTGALDTSFSFDGKVTTDFFGYADGAKAVAVQNDGKRSEERRVGKEGRRGG